MTRSDTHPAGRLSALAHKVLDAAVRTPTRPPDPLLWPRHVLLRVMALVWSLGLAIGFTGGSIAIYINVYHVGVPQSWLLGLLQALPLLGVALRPLACWRIAAAGLLLGLVTVGDPDLFWNWPVTSFLALLVMLGAVAVCHERRTTVAVGLLTVAIIVLAIPMGRWEPWFALILAGIVIVVLVFGDAVHGRYAAEASLAEQTELRRRDLAHQAVLEERARIARELHDIVAHHMSVIAMQAEAAPYKIPELPEAAKSTFVLVRDAARDALTETRRVVGLLRTDAEAAERVPQPGLQRLPELIEAGRDAGLNVESQVLGVPRPVDAGVDLSAYRIVQESLSNAARYAPGSRAWVRIAYRDRELEVSVTDDGARGTPEESGGGHGLVGMRERVAMLGGILSAGPEGTGWRVLARLPYEGSARPRAEEPRQRSVR